jgi:hypothetical protein
MCVTEKTNEPQHVPAFSQNAACFTGGFIVFAFDLLFVLPWWNKYLGITNEGWYQFFGKQILEGRVPYRDFYLFVPPGQAFTMAALSYFFGNRVLVPEVFGFVEVIVLATALYVWLARVFSPYSATVAVVSASAVYLRVSTESLSGLHLDANLYPVLALVTASFALHRTGWSRSLVALAGFCTGMAFIIKQTGGVASIAALGLFLPVILAARLRLREGLKAGVLLAIGWSVPVFLTAMWLVSHGAFGSFLADVFLTGTSSKGSIVSLLGRQVSGIIGDRYLAESAAFAFLVVLTAGFLLSFTRNTNQENERPAKGREIVYTCVFGTIAVVLCFWAQHRPGMQSTGLHRLDFLSQDVLLYVGELGSLGLLVACGALLVRRRLSWVEEQLFLGAGTSFACAFIFSFSWADAKIMLVPACPFVLAFGLSRIPAGRMKPLAEIAAAVGLLICITVGVRCKMQEPYYWADWHQRDALRATAALEFPELRGIKVTPETAAVVRRVVDDIQKYSRPDEPVAEFSTMPIFYMLAHRSPATFAYIHYVDVTPDYIYVKDARTLERAPPAVIVFLSRSATELREGEVNFRNGRLSGERELWKTLETLKCRYQVVDVLQSPNTPQQLEIWAKLNNPSQQACEENKIELK